MDPLYRASWNINNAAVGQKKLTIFQEVKDVVAI
jgi:hypothetical protein